MKANPLVLALVVLAVLGGAVYYTMENPPEPDDDTVKLVDAKEDDIQEVMVLKPGGETITVVRGEDKKWKFGGGLTIPADESAVGLMVTNLAGLSASRVVEEQVTNWGPFGLDGDGSLAVEMKAAEGVSKKFIFGDETPTGAGVFCRIDSDPRLFTVYNYVKTSFDKSVFDWRNKKLLQVDGDKISRVRLTVGSKSYEFGKTGTADWQILQPAPLRADNFTVGDLARSIQNAEMTQVIAETPEASAEHSFARPYAVAEIVDETGAHTLTIEKQGESSYYAKSSDQAGVYEISSSVADSLDKNLDELRNKKLFDFGFDPLTRLEVRAGDTRAVVEKKDDRWLLTSDGGREIDSSKAQTLIDSLRNLTAISFPSDSAADQAKYGLSQPTLELSATREGAEAEKVVVSDPSKDRIYAARSGEATTYEVEKAPAEEIQRALEDLLKAEEPQEAEKSESSE